MRELKAHLSRYLARARAGQSIVVTDRGQPIAVIGPVDSDVVLREPAEPWGADDVAPVGDEAASRLVETGIRDLKANLSRYIRRVEQGEQVAVTSHGRIVAELVPPGTGQTRRPRSRWDELIAAGVLRPPVDDGDPFEHRPELLLPRGTAAALIDQDRGEG
ncbi:MAG: type II toxin-antitoxin system Phd/YefM family antitoxin [Vicinamibacterales bacterium]